MARTTGNRLVGGSERLSDHLASKDATMIALDFRGPTPEHIGFDGLQGERIDNGLNGARNGLTDVDAYSWHHVFFLIVRAPASERRITPPRGPPHSPRGAQPRTYRESGSSLPTYQQPGQRDLRRR